MRFLISISILSVFNRSSDTGMTLWQFNLQYMTNDFSGKNDAYRNPYYKQS